MSSPKDVLRRHNSHGSSISLNTKNRSSNGSTSSLNGRNRSFTGSNNSLNGKGRVSPKDKIPPEFSRTGSRDNVRSDFTRTGSRDNIRRIVEKEGKIARNLVVYSVPTEQGEAKSMHKQRGRNRTRQNKNKKDNLNQHEKHLPPQQDAISKHKNNSKQPSKVDINAQQVQQSQQQINQSKDTSDMNAIRKSNQERESVTETQNDRETKSEQYQERIRKVIECSTETAKPEPRSSSANFVQSQKNIRARYWSYLFDNFHRAVDEIYSTCEHDESIIECEEVIMMLDVCKRDFLVLIKRLELFNKLETSDIKPQSLAWEVRKQVSPGKCPSPTVSSRRSPSPAAVRYLNFGPTKSSSFSWADRVRGVNNNTNNSTPKDVKETKIKTNDSIIGGVSKSYPSPVLEKSTEDKENEEDDGEGWEVVTKGRSRSKNSSISLSSSSSNQSHLKNNMLNKYNNNTTQPVQSLLKPTSNHQTIPVYNTTAQKDKKITSKELTLVSQPEFPESRKSCEKINEINYNRENTLTEESMHQTPLLNIGSEVDELVTNGDYVHVKSEDLNGINGYTTEYPDLDYDDYHLGDNVNIDDDINLQIKEEQEKALASAIAEEETLTKELEEEALKDEDQDDEMSSERDDVTTDDGRETPKDLSDELPLDSSASFEDFDGPMTWEELCTQYDREHEGGISNSWADMMDKESVRMPGRALEIHQKLSSPSRRKSRSESLRRSEERMARAERRRLRLLVEKCQRLKALSEKVRNVRELKNQLILEKEKTIQEQLKRAELNRKILIQEKIRKAQEEELKVNEIAFINTLEAQNRKIEVQEKHQVSEARLQELMDERQRRREDKQAKEEAAQERRRALEEERLARLQEIKQKRGDQAAKWEKERVEREKVREELAKERQREREMKVAARNEALQLATEELQKRIELKHIESTRRHEQRIEEVKEKSRAASSSRHATVEETPSCLPYEKVKKCTLCDVEITSDVYMVSHLKGKKHRTAIREINRKVTDAEMEAFSSKYIKDSDTNHVKKQKEEDEKAKAMKKRAKKIKARMASKSKDYESNPLSDVKPGECQKRGRFQRAIKEINKVLQAQSNGPWPATKITALDKSISDICRSLEANNPNDQLVFCQLGGLAVLARILLLWDPSCTQENVAKNSKVPPKIIKHVTEAIMLSCTGNHENCQYMLLGNKLTILVDLLLCKLQFISENNPSLKEAPPQDDSARASPGVSRKSRGHSLKLFVQKFKDDDQLTLTIMKTISIIFKMFTPKLILTKSKKGTDKVAVDMQQRLNDISSYIISIGIFDKLLIFYRTIQGPVEDTTATDSINVTVSFTQAVVFSAIRLDSTFVTKKEDLSMLSQTMKSTEAFGLVGLLYALLHQGNATRISPSPLPLAESSITILVSVFKTLNALALLDINSFQNTVASEGVSLQYRSVISYLLRYTSNEKCDDLLHEVILSIGFFATLNSENQFFLQYGRAPTPIQQLCSLPFGYFSDPKLKAILFPALICLSYNNIDNKKSIAQEVSPTLLGIFLEENIKKPSPDSQHSIENIHQRSVLDIRFPKVHWEDAKEYFTESEQS